jgi:ribosomal protein L37E
MQALRKWESAPDDHFLIISCARCGFDHFKSERADCGFTQQIKLRLHRLVCKMQPGQVDKTSPNN